MPPSAAPARIYQIGTQADFSTPLAAATARLLVPELQFTNAGNVERPHLLDAMVRSPGHDFVNMRGTNWSLPVSDVTFEQLPGLLACAIEGGVTATQAALSGDANEAVTTSSTTLADSRLDMTPNEWVGGTVTCDGKTGVVVSNTDTTFTVDEWQGGTPTTGSAWSVAGLHHTYAFARGPYALPALDFFTVERRLTDYTNHVDDAFAKCGIQTWTLQGARNGNIQFSANGPAGRRISRSLTGAVPIPEVEHVPFSLSRVCLDDEWDDLGDTPITGRVLSWGITASTGFVPDRTADLNDDLDWDVALYDGEQVSHEVRIRLMQDKTLYEAERALAESQAERAVRIEVQGTANRRIVVDALGKYEQDTIVEVASENGQVVYDIVLRETTDGTNLLAASVVNNVDGDVWGIPQ